MRDEFEEDGLHELREALRITPSPDFTARVRERVQQDRASAWSAGVWRFAFAAAGLVVVAAAGVMWWPMGRVRVVPGQPTDGPVQAHLVQAPVAVPQVVPVQRPLAPVTLPVRTSAPIVVPAARRAVALVPDDERVMLNRLLVAVRDGRTAVPSAGGKKLEDEEGHLLEPRSIEIPLMKAIELLPGTPADRSGSGKQ